MTTLRWTSPFWPSLFHALRWVAEGRPVVDPALADSLQPFAQTLCSWSLPDGYWSCAIPRVARDAALEHLPLAQWDARQGDGLPQAEGRAEELVGLLEESALVFRQQRPRLADELSLRLGPLRQQWLARGPGLIRRLNQVVAPSTLLSADVQVIGVAPIGGGAGEAYPAEQALLIESLLTNVDDRLPELARLAWLVVQVGLPSDLCPGTLVDPAIWRPRAALLLTLALGQQLEWFTDSAPPLELALQAWLGPTGQTAEAWAARLPNDWYRPLVARDDVDRLLAYSLFGTPQA